MLSKFYVITIKAYATSDKGDFMNILYKYKPNSSFSFIMQVIQQV